VARAEDDARGAGNRQLATATVVPHDLLHGSREPCAVADERGDDRQRVELGEEVARPRPLVVVAPGMAGQRHVVLVHIDGHPELGSRALGEAEVVEVPVGEHDGLHVVRLAAQALDGVEEGPPRSRHSGVHDGEPPVVLDEVPVRVRVLDPVDARCRVGMQHRVRQ
jgi:hypothetical protein